MQGARLAHVHGQVDEDVDLVFADACSEGIVVEEGHVPLAAKAAAECSVTKSACGLWSSNRSRSARDRARFEQWQDEEAFGVVVKMVT